MFAPQNLCTFRCSCLRGLFIPNHTFAFLVQQNWLIFYFKHVVCHWKHARLHLVVCIYILDILQYTYIYIQKFPGGIREQFIQLLNIPYAFRMGTLFIVCVTFNLWREKHIALCCVHSITRIYMKYCFSLFWCEENGMDIPYTFTQQKTKQQKKNHPCHWLHLEPISQLKTAMKSFYFWCSLTPLFAKRLNMTISSNATLAYSSFDTIPHSFVRYCASKMLQQHNLFGVLYWHIEYVLLPHSIVRQTQLLENIHIAISILSIKYTLSSFRFFVIWGR